jgi:hypothetical protein
MHKKPDLKYWAFKVVVCQQNATCQQSKELHRWGGGIGGMRAKLLEAVGLIASTVQRQTHNILGSISATENSTLLAIIFGIQRLKM